MKPETQTPIAGAHLSDAEVANIVAMLLRSDINHEAVLAIARDRIRHLSERAERMEKDLRIAELKNASSLANNLCPDHRDKQQGKPCLACHIERLERALRALINAEMDWGIDREMVLADAREALTPQTSKPKDGG